MGTASDVHSQPRSLRAGSSMQAVDPRAAFATRFVRADEGEGGPQHSVCSLPGSRQVQCTPLQWRNFAPIRSGNTQSADKDDRKTLKRPKRQNTTAICGEPKMADFAARRARAVFRTGTNNRVKSAPLGVGVCSTLFGQEGAHNGTGCQCPYVRRADDAGAGGDGRGQLSASHGECLFTGPRLAWPAAARRPWHGELQDLEGVGRGSHVNMGHVNIRSAAPS